MELPDASVDAFVCIVLEHVFDIQTAAQDNPER